MNDQEKLKSIQDEIYNLQQELFKQHKRIQQLQEQLHGLRGSEVEERVEDKAKIKRGSIGIRWSLENFIGLKLIQFIGIIVLVIGISIGVKYAIDRELISEFMRIALAYAAGFLLYFLSLRLKRKYLVFSAILFSGAMASVYFTTYAAHVYYHMFPFAFAFILMVALTVFTTYEAIRYNRQEIALLGLVGAYAIPFLISKNAERADLFFLYITLINLAVVFLAARKKWRSVASIAHFITWVLFIGWAAIRFDTRFQTTGFLFMTTFFLIFHFSILAPKIMNKERLQVNANYGLILNNVALYLAALFIFGFSFEMKNLAIITFIISFLTALQALGVYFTWKNETGTVSLLSLLALALFVFFIALNWDGFTVTFLWLLTAVIVFISGVRLRSVQARLTAIVLIGLTLGKLLVLDSMLFTTIQKVIAYLVLGILLLLVSFFYQKFRKQIFENENGGV